MSILPKFALIPKSVVLCGSFRLRFKKIDASFFLLFGTLMATQAPAQTSPPLHLESITIDQGLSQGYVSGIVQDKKGFMWFATGDGLNKYDGYTFTVYHNDPDDTTSLGSDDLTCVFEDTKERLWVGTRHKGIDLFDREKGLFTHVRHTDENSLRSDDVMDITEDKKGALWIRTAQGVDCLEILEGKSVLVDTQHRKSHPPQTAVFTHITFDGAVAAAEDKFEMPGVFVDSRNRVLLTTSNKIWEVKFSGRLRSYSLTERYRFPMKYPTYIATLLEDTVNHGLYLKTTELIRFAGGNFNSAKTLPVSVDMLAPWTIDKAQRLWIPASSRIERISTSSGQIEHAGLESPDVIRTLSYSKASYTDRTGVIWFGTGGYGILKYAAEKESFHHILPGNYFYQLLKTGDGRLLTNTFQELTIKKNSPVVINPLMAPDVKKKMADGTVFSFALDGLDNCWYSTSGSLLRYNRKTKQLQKYLLPVAETGVAPFPLFADRMNNVWMGYNRYIIRYDPSAGTFKKVSYPVDLKVYPFEFLQCIYEDDSLMWLGSVNGLFRLNTKTDDIKQYRYQQSDTASLSNDLVLSLCNDIRQPRTYLWVGTRGGGLNRLDKRTGKITRYTTRHGLPNNVVYGILPDEKNNLWLSTNEGLSRFNLTTKRFRNFDVSDGLQSNEFNRYAYCKTNEGLLVFGGMNGMNYFDPNEVEALEPPNVLLTDFLLFNQSVDFKMPRAPLTKNISFTDTIVLRYQQNVVTFQFAALDYRKAGNALYRYRMQGFDHGWIYSGTKREATYTNLDPGTYQFVVQGSFDDALWGPRQTALTLIIIPPWWGTWWFYGLVSILTFSITYALYRYRLAQILRLERVRNRIARDLHDEVGSSISTIAIYSKIMQEKLGSASFNNEPLLKKITDNAHEIMEAMSDIVWNVNAKNDAFDLIIIRMREHAHQLFEAKGYALHFRFDEALAGMKLEMEKRRDFYLIYKEALNNIAKYAAGKNVWISLGALHGQIQLSIRDDGKGFDRETVRKTSNGLSNMQQRAALLHGKIEISSAPGKGTEIRLVF